MSSKVLIAGAGVAGLEAALALRELAGGLLDVELVSPETDFVYRPLAVAEPFQAGEARRFPLHQLAEAAGATLTRAAVRSVDPERRMVVTSNGTALRYDSLLLALGARSVAALPGALTFKGPGDEEAFAALLHDARSGQVDRLVFALPVGASWPLPLYELALLTAVHLADAGASGVQLSVVTPEQRPLQLFGAAASEAVKELLELHGVDLLTDTTPVAVEDRALRLLPDQRLEADRVVALPRLEGPRLAGLTHDANGFVPTDQHGRVRGLYDVYAAGDLTDFPVKQGGIATQQADAAAESMAAAAGAPIEPQSASSSCCRPRFRCSHATASTGCLVSRTTSTGRRARCRTPRDTLPSSALEIAPWPCEPTTIRSAWIEPASSTIFLAGSPTSSLLSERRARSSASRTAS